MALEAIRSDPATWKEFREGVKDRSGRVDRARTEASLTFFLEIHEFFPEEIRVIVRLSPHVRYPLSAEQREATERAIRERVGLEPTIALTRGERKVLRSS